MEKIAMNGNSTALANYETPFADVGHAREQEDHYISSEEYTQLFSETESPFSRTYEAASTTSVSQLGEEYVQLVANLHDHEFNETLFEMANEMEETWRNKVSDEIAMANNFVPFVTQQARTYFEPVLRETETIIDRIAEHFSGNNLADQSEASVQMFFETLEYGGTQQYTPAQEQFFGKIIKTVKNVVKKGVDIAKKGIAAVGKILPIGPILNKIKGLIKPLLDKVLKFAIGKLPKNLQPHAQTLAKKLLSLETEEENMVDNEEESGVNAIQTEFNHHVAQLLFSADETEAESAVVTYEASDETLERESSYEAGYPSGPSLDAARQQFINELKDLQAGESPAPAIERFLPVAIMALQPVIKIAISIIGRQKVINFLAGLLAKLVSKYVPANIAQPLAASIIDVGMSAIGFETHESSRSDLAYEAIANTIEDTVRNMGKLNEATLSNNEDLTMHMLEAFEQAAANNFPSQYIRDELRPTKQKGLWVAMPRNLPVKLYKKFTHVFDVTIDSKMSGSVTTFRDLPLNKFLKDKYGLDTNKPVKARVHVYELNRGRRLSSISKFEKLPGLNARQPRSWVQLLPLTKQAATVLLNEPNLGKDFPSKNISSRFRPGAGQRFYYLDIEGARLRLVPGKKTGVKPGQNTSPAPSAPANESRSADIQGVIDFIKSEIRLNYFFSEEDAKDVVEKLNKKDFLGAGISIRQSVRKVLNDILIKNIPSKVKLIHEAIPELYLENIPDTEAFSGEIGKAAGKEIVMKLVEKLIDKIAELAYDAIVNFFKARAAEFKEAQAEPKDGVTVKLTWSNIPGMSAIRAIINAIRGKLSLGNLADLAIPSLPLPDIKIIADKHFD